MRIGLISSGTARDRMPPIYGGGIQKHIWNLGRDLHNLGHEVHIFVRWQHKQPKEEVIKGVIIHRIDGFSRFKLFATFFFGLRTIFKLFRVEKSRGAFDIIHTQSRVSGLLIRRAFRQKPIIFTAHNWDIAYTSPGDRIPFISYALTLFIEKRIYSQCEKIITLTNHFEHILIERYKVNPKKISVIPNMVKVQDYSIKYPIKDSKLQKILLKKYLIFIGRLEQEKGLESLIENYHLILEKNKDLNLVIIGVGSLKEDLMKLEKRTDLRENIFLLGNLHEMDKIYLLKAAKALILPSDYEILPTVILEAWATDCIVIVNRYYGLDKFIQHKINGILYNKVESNELPTLIHEALNNEDLRKDLIQNSKILINTKYSSSSISQQILNIYHHSLTKR